MIEGRKAVFAFETFRIHQFSLTELNYSNEALNAQFDPHGAYNPETGLFLMTLNFRTTFTEQPEAALITAKLTATFRFADPIPQTLDELPGYFYKNAIAIVFPYLRAFISNLTLQANIQPIILPVFNLSALEQPFREQTNIEGQLTL